MVCASPGDLCVNYALCDAMLAAGAEQLDRFGLGGESYEGIFLKPEDLVLDQKLTVQRGATCQVWRGSLRGQVGVMWMSLC